MIQHLLHHGPGWTEISLLCNQITVAKSKGHMDAVCTYYDGPELFFTRMFIFSHVHNFPTQPSFWDDCVSERYWFIISDSCDIHSYYSPLRTCFQSLLEVEPEKNNTHKMISGFNFNGNCSLFPYSIIFLGNNS